MQQAVEVGAQYVIASPPMDPFDLSRGGADYRELLEVGAEIGVRPAMEYLGFMKSIYTIDQAWRIVGDADHPDASIMDPFHILRGGGPIESIAKRARREGGNLALERRARRQAIFRTVGCGSRAARRRGRAASRD